MFTIKVPKSGCGYWWVSMIVLAVMFANKFDPFFLWDIGFCDIQNNGGRGGGYQPKPKAEADNPYRDLEEFE